MRSVRRNLCQHSALVQPQVSTLGVLQPQLSPLGLLQPKLLALVQAQLSGLFHAKECPLVPLAQIDAAMHTSHLHLVAHHSKPPRPAPA